MAHPPDKPRAGGPISKFWQKMAALAGVPPEPNPDGVTPLDVIFSCCVCNASFSEVYSGEQNTVQMLSDGINPKDRIVTRLFFASCCHVFCTKHLEGGGAPFHAAGTRPRAACPVCSKEGELYSIRGFSPGEYDPAIPACWFVTPPVKLETNEKGMEALRFQYMSLITYSTQITQDHRKVKKELDTAQSELQSIKSASDEAQAKVQRLEQENMRLRDLESELNRIRARLPEVRHYLSIVPKIAEQNDQMRTRLASLGFQMHFEPLAFDKYKPPSVDDDGDGYGDDRHRSGTASNFTGHRSADTLVNSEHPMTSSSQARPLKRQRRDSPSLTYDLGAGRKQHMVDDRAQMPPPEKPLSRMRSVKKLFPTLRKKTSSPYTSPTDDNSPDYPSHLNMGEGRDVENNSFKFGTGSLFRRRHIIQEETHQASRAHQRIDAARSVVPEQQMGCSRGFHVFSFRSPVQPSPSRRTLLPNEPSYIRLMDPLSQDSRLELGLMDPRQRHAGNDTNQLNHNTEYQREFQPEAEQEGQGEGSRWRSGQTFVSQSLNDPAASTYDSSNHYRPNPPRESVGGQGSRYHANPLTPAPQRTVNPGHMEESVVSPFFKSSSRASQRFSRPGVNQLNISSPRHSSIYPYRGQKVAVQADWHEPRGLNGLSFFASPVNTKNEPILQHPGDMSTFGLTDRHYMAHRATPLGLSSRAHQQAQPIDRQSYQPAERLSYPKQFQPLHRSSALPPQSSRQHLSRPAALPQTLPSIVRDNRTAQGHYGGPSYSGIRASRNHLVAPSYGRRDMHMSNSRGLFSSAGQRSVRR
ncbi:uncharacterized protein EI97DRAFT_81631 [Westerdykella ornata]|uniref:Uncharacterized protein n=1 Tax=Westerdykella ornata TaxID=318751 RepID=A0A6A6JFN1_WESOR|nr:uncharacterized protein EI97DRAFT_81631 [Westerdykella ornata]KAF2275222.1 hypothetical protein EI97DRAFT_81631 [Westerdykella ornata]